MASGSISGSCAAGASLFSPFEEVLWFDSERGWCDDDDEDEAVVFDACSLLVSR